VAGACATSPKSACATADFGHGGLAGADGKPIEHVRLVAQAVIQTLGRQTPPWTVLHVGWTPEEVVAAPQGTAISFHSQHSELPLDLEVPAEHSQLVVELGTGARSSGEAVAAYYPLYVPTAEAIAVLASQIQDHATEADSSRGRPLPPCPGHAHPLVVQVVEDVAVWQCPQSPAHLQEPVMPGHRA
jgi:hypothetical protein